MAKTLRIRTKDGWDTKPAADLPENRLLAEEVDDNFLALEADIALRPRMNYGVTPPANPEVGVDVWLNPESGVTYIWNDDGSSQQWVEYSVPGSIVLDGSLRTGQVVLVPSTMQDATLLPMDGASYPRVNYPALAALFQLSAPAGAEIFNLPDVTSGIVDLAFSPDGTRLAHVSGGNNDVVIVNTVTWENDVAATNAIGTNNIGATEHIRYSPDGAWLAVQEATGSVRVFNTSDWTIAAHLTALDNLENIAFSADSALFAITRDSPSDDLIVIVYETTGWTPVHTVTDSVYYYAHATYATFDPAGPRMAYVNEESNKVIVLDTTDWSTITTISTGGGSHYELAFSPDGGFLAVIVDATQDVVQVYETTTWGLVTEIPASNPRSLDFSSDGLLLAIGRSQTSQSLLVYDVATWLPVTNVVDIPSSLDVRWNPTANVLAVGGNATGATYGNLRAFIFDVVFTLFDATATSPIPGFEYRIKV